MFGEETVIARRVVVFHKTSWGTEPFTRGSYANYATGVTAIFLSHINLCCSLFLSTRTKTDIVIASAGERGIALSAFKPCLEGSVIWLVVLNLCLNNNKRKAFNQQD